VVVAVVVDMKRKPPGTKDLYERRRFIALGSRMLSLLVVV